MADSELPVANYEVIAPRYDRRYAGKSYEGIEQVLLGSLDGVEGLDVLEVGCGTGHWLGVLASRVGRIVGLDPSTGMLSHARSAVTGALLARGRAEDLPFATGSFDRAFCVNAFHHFRSKVQFLAEARRVLRAGGALMIVGLDPHAGRDAWWVYDNFPETLALDRRRFLSGESIRTSMTDAGFRECKTVEVHRIVRQMSAGGKLAPDLVDRRFTSQLMILSDQEYGDGLRRIGSRIEAAAAKGEDLVLSTDLWFYATVGWAM